MGVQSSRVRLLEGVVVATAAVAAITALIFGRRDSRTVVRDAPRRREVVREREIDR